jgi:hypothetical protein
MSDGGKGDKPRPFSVTKEKYDEAWNRIFKEKNGSYTVNVEGKTEITITQEKEIND